jgi:hypothetical protein
VPVVIIERSDQAMMALGFRENYTHRRLSAWEEGLFFLRLQVDEGYTIRGIEAVLGLSKGVVQNRLDLVKLPEGSPILDAYRQRTIDMTSANLLRLITRDMSSEQIDQLVAEVRAGAVSKADLEHMKRSGGDQPGGTLPSAPQTEPRAPAVASADVPHHEGPVPARPNRFAGLTLDDDSSPTSPRTASPFPPIVPCGVADAALLAAGVLQVDGTDMAAQPEATQATYRLLHAMSEFIPMPSSTRPRRTRPRCPRRHGRTGTTSLTASPTSRRCCSSGTEGSDCCPV